ncbi:MAG: hypothetical protein Q8L48_16220 [Archangium sp.]|nr:hypothetical protein [Archangium sp.]
MALMLGVGLVIWRYGLFGLLPTDRTLVWRLPVSYGEVRKLELQVWDEHDLLKREEQLFAAGLVGEPTLQVPLSSGPHRAIANVWLMGATAAIGFQREFNPGADETILIEMKKP